MEVRLQDLAKMSRKERNRTLDQMAQEATAHRGRRSIAMHFRHVFYALQNFVGLRRAPR